MKKINSIFIIIIIILMLGLSGCKQDDNKQLINLFLNEYYSQFNITESERNKILSDLENEGYTLGIDGDIVYPEENYVDENEANPDTDDTISFIDKYNKYLTQQCIDRLMANRYLPNFYMMDSEVDSFEINNLSIENIDNGNYNIEYELKLFKGDKAEIENKKIYIRIVDNKDHDKKLIDYLKGDLYGG